jgi:hypothetical protein
MDPTQPDSSSAPSEAATETVPAATDQSAGVPQQVGHPLAEQTGSDATEGDGTSGGDSSGIGDEGKAPPSELDPGKVTVTAFAAYAVMWLFLIIALFVHNPPDLSKLGVSGLVTTVLGIIVTPQNSKHDTWWWTLAGLTGAGIVTSGVLALFDSGGFPSAAPVLAAFVGAFSGLLTDGSKLRLPASGRS